MSEEDSRVKVEKLLDDLRLKIQKTDSPANLKQQEEVYDLVDRLTFYINRLLLGMK